LPSFGRKPFGNGERSIKRNGYTARFKSRDNVKATLRRVEGESFAFRLPFRLRITDSQSSRVTAATGLLPMTG